MYDNNFKLTKNDIYFNFYVPHISSPTVIEWLIPMFWYSRSGVATIIVFKDSIRYLVQVGYKLPNCSFNFVITLVLVGKRRHFKASLTSERASPLNMYSFGYKKI